MGTVYLDELFLLNLAVDYLLLLAAGRMAGELEQILSYMDVLDGLDTSGAEPMSHIVPLKNVLREDETAPSMDRGELLKNAPATDGGTFLVPKAVE